MSFLPGTNCQVTYFRNLAGGKERELFANSSPPPTWKDSPQKQLSHSDRTDCSVLMGLLKFMLRRSGWVKDGHIVNGLLFF